MIDLKTAIEICSEEIRNEGYCRETIDRYLLCLKKLQELANESEIDKPCQILFDDFINRYTCKDDRINRKIVIKRLDKIAESNCLNENGILYNMKPFLTEEELIELGNNYHFPVDEGEGLHQLISFVLSLMKEKLGKSTYGQYCHTFSYLYSWSVANGITDFNKKVLGRYLQIIEENYSNGAIPEWIYKIRKRSVNILLEVADTGEFKWHLYKKKKQIDEWRTKLLNKYLKIMDDCSVYSDSYLYLHKYIFLELMNILQVNKDDDLSKLKRKDFEVLCDKLHDKFNQKSISTVYPIARKIITFLYETGLIDMNYSMILLSPNYFREYNPCIISKDDEMRIIKYLDQCSLRNRAIMLLAIRYGLRESDICKLKFEEIDWYRETIFIRQKKTEVPLVLPLLDDVGNAIIDYIEKERPKVDNPYIFLRAQIPYKELGGAYEICKKILDDLNISTSNGKGKGIHVFRYTLTKRLLEAQIPHQVVTDSLGHTSKDSDKYYYSMEEEKLSLCCLDVRWIGVKSWK